MSLLDGKVVLAGEPLNSSREERHGNNNKRNRYTSNDYSRPGKDRRYEDDYYTFSNSSYLPEEERSKSNNEHESIQEERVDSRAQEVFAFVDEFVDNVNNYRSLQDVVSQQFPDVVQHMRHYYNPKNSPTLTDALNKFLKIVCQTQFAKTLKSVLESGMWSEDETYDRIWRNIAYTLSIALETNHTRMHTDVIKIYATDILPRMWKPDITDIVTSAGITSDLALDLIIALPIFGGKWNGTNIDIFYNRFLSKMLIHADDNIDVLNWEVQGILYDKFFGKSKTALNVIGKYLVYEPVTVESESVSAVYTDFKKMLYAKLDKHDIKDIEYVLRYVVEFREKHSDKNVIFDSREATQFDNVKRGLLATMDKNPDAMKYLA